MLFDPGIDITMREKGKDRMFSPLKTVRKSMPWYVKPSNLHADNGTLCELVRAVSKIKPGTCDGYIKYTY